jgi:ATP-dependent RNA helicase DHR2
MKARGIDNVISFPLLSPPPREAVEKALLQLYHLQALDDLGQISPMGMQIAKMPLSAPLGRVLLAAAEPRFDCLTEVIDIISCFSVENVFLNITSEEKKEEAEDARKELFRRDGYHLTLLATVQAYTAENADRKAWAERHFVSHRAMQAVMVIVPDPLFIFPPNNTNFPSPFTGCPQTTPSPMPTIKTSTLSPSPRRNRLS